ncbi:MAG: hypothetical protein ACFNVK_10185 [Prevotella sp.]
MKHMAKKGKIAVKKWGLGAKSGQFGVEKIRVGNQTRKAKWCKMQLTFLKTDKAKGMKE